MSIQHWQLPPLDPMHALLSRYSSSLIDTVVNNVGRSYLSGMAIQLELDWSPVLQRANAAAADQHAGNRHTASESYLSEH